LPKLGDAVAAEDALVETFRKALERLPQFQDRGKGLWPYLSTIALQPCPRRAPRARPARAGAVQLRGLAGAAAGGVAFLPRRRPDRAKVRTAVAGVLEALNPRYRRAIELRFFQEHSREECAKLLEVKLGTFDVLLLRFVALVPPGRRADRTGPSASPMGTPRRIG
jgi:RNA polymerase sigma-70 factor (ECF subfamily)